MMLKSIFKKVQAFTGALAASLVVLTPVWADDTEIFFADTGGENIWPNVLFIIDTSGSMNNDVKNPDGTSTGKDRLEHVQDAMKTILDNFTNVNVGLMRFSNPGGPVLYPVFDIDADVATVKASTVIARISDDDDDAQELATTGEVLVDEDHLYLTQVTVGLDSFDDFISSWTDDAEEDVSDGDMTRGSNDLDFRGGGVGSRKYVGLHFRGSAVPAGSIITQAYITFTAYDSSGLDNSDIPFTIYAEKDDASDGSQAFDSNNSEISFRLTDDPSNITAGVDWTLTGTYSDGQKVTTPNLAAMVQDIVDHANWNPGSSEDDMTFIFEPKAGSSDGRRELVTYDGSDSVGERPQLMIEYYDGSAATPASEQTTTGLRFKNIAVPRGVTVKEAYIEFNASQSATGSYNFSITAEDDGAPATYTTATNDITARTQTAAAITWAGSDPVVAGEVFKTPDISGLVQTVAARGDWCGGNDMAFMITGTDGLRTAWSHDGEASLSPRLVIKYDYSTIPVGSSCYKDIISRRVSKGTDDAEEAGTTVSTTGQELNMQSSPDSNHIGVLFKDLGIPKNATIINAYIEFTERKDQDTGNTAMTIYVEDTGNATPYTGTDGTIDGRTYSGTTAAWSITQDWYQDQVYQTPDISALVAAASGHAGWVAGNAMSFRFVTTGPKDRRAYSFNGSAGEAPRLVVEYAADGSDKASLKVRDELKAVIDGLSHSGWTPVQDTLYEASQYYAGKDVLWGAKRGGPNDSGPHTYTRVSHEASMVPGTYSINYPTGCTEEDLGHGDCRYQTISGVGGSATYASPINNYCQKTNHIVLLTDGYANKDHSGTQIKNFVGLGASACTDTGTGSGGTCVKDLASYMKTADMSDLKQTQSVITHTVGFNFASTWLKDVAVAGGGEFIVANNSQQLVDAIGDLIVDMLKVDNTFVAPVAAVNQFNRLNHLNDIYFAVFRPDEVPRWNGNVKKFGLGVDNVVEDINDLEAVETSTGFFKPGAIDFWDSMDPNAPYDPNAPVVERGGAASQLATHSARKIYTYHSNSGTKKLKALENHLHVDQITSGELTKAMFNAGTLTDAEFADLVQWTRGKDVDAAGDVDRYSFGDPLHSRPVAVTYNVSETDPDVEIFVGSNAGSLQSINAKTGEETFSFFPQATLPLQITLKENKSTWPHGYGIDGNIVPWVRDNNADGIDPSDSEDAVHLFFGMRRGGYNYYSLDVTDRNDPYLNWVLEGGTGDFAEMGQTWGTPIAGRIRLKDESERDVLFISGGYEPAKDDYTTRVDDVAGRAVYIVDADNGELIWVGSPAASGDLTDGYNKQFVDMKYSIPATLTVADVDADGLDDIIVVGDTGGQLWRFDIAIGAEAKDLVSGGVIADLGVAAGANTEQRNRRFFHSPDIALTKVDGALELAITIGSGFRPSPLSIITEDRFYMVRQSSVFGPPASYTKILESDLYDATDNKVDDGVAADGSTVTISDEEDALSAKQGWYISLHDPSSPGEKVLSTPLSFKDQLAFITYTPNSSIFDCKAKAGISKVYFVHLGDASPVKNWSDVNGGYCEGTECDENDRVSPLNTPSIVDEPVFICTEEGGCTVFTGAEKPPIDPLTSNRIVKTYWRKDN